MRRDTAWTGSYKMDCEESSVPGPPPPPPLPVHPHPVIVLLTCFLMHVH